MKRKPMPLYVRLDRYNNHNVHEYDPYVVTSAGEVLIDEYWWFSLSPFTQSQIESVTTFQIEEYISVPHTLCAAHPALTAIYWAYIEGFDYQHWYSDAIPNGPKEVKLIALKEHEKETLRTGCYTEIE